MSDDRPRPLYGEYATPEEQRAAMGVPAEPVLPAVPAPVPTSDAAASESAPRRDRFITYALLAYGLVSVMFSGPSYLNLAPTINEVYATFGIDASFTNFAAGRTWGMIAITVLVVGWVVTTLLSLRCIRARKLSWWVPLVGGVVTMLLASMCLMVPLMGDAAFLEYVQQASRP